MPRKSLSLPLFPASASVMPEIFSPRRKWVWSVFLLACLCFLPGVGQAGQDQYRLIPELTVFKVKPEGGVTLSRPEGVACKGQSIVVADTGNGRLVRYTLANGKIQFDKVIKLVKGSRPTQVHLGSKGDIFYLDARQRLVMHAAPGSDKFKAVVPAGVPHADSMIIRAFDLDAAGDLYLLDLFGQRVIITDAALKYKREIPLPEEDQTYSALPVEGQAYSDVAVNSQGKIFLLESIKAMIYTTGSDGKEFKPFTKSLKQFMTFPTNFTPDNHGGLLVVDSHGDGIVRIGPDGSYQGRQLTMGWKPGLLYYPAQLSLTAHGQAVIADRGNSRFQIFKIASK